MNLKNLKNYGKFKIRRWNKMNKEKELVKHLRIVSKFNYYNNNKINN